MFTYLLSEHFHLKALCIMIARIMSHSNTMCYIYAIQLTNISDISAVQTLACMRQQLGAGWFFACQVIKGALNTLHIWK